MKRPMVAFLTQLLLAIRSRFSRRVRLEAENLILRQQLVALRRRSSTRVRLWSIDRLLFVWSYRLYPSLLDAIIIVQPETVIRWHQRGFRSYWHWKSRHVGGRPRIDSGIRDKEQSEIAEARDRLAPWKLAISGVCKLVEQLLDDCVRTGLITAQPGACQMRDETMQSDYKADRLTLNVIGEGTIVISPTNDQEVGTGRLDIVNSASQKRYAFI